MLSSMNLNSMVYEILTSGPVSPNARKSDHLTNARLHVLNLVRRIFRPTTLRQSSTWYVGTLLGS